MSVLFQQRAVNIADAVPGIGNRGRMNRWTHVTRATAMRHSAVWAATRVRADLISTLPIDVFRKTAFGNIEVPTPPVLRDPSGSTVDITEWMYNTQVDLDTVGNTFGIITELDGGGMPRRIDLVPREEVIVRVKDGQLRYLIGGDSFEPNEIWHERQYTMSGLVVGLSPIAHAALSVQQSLSAQEFAANWFSGGAIPSAILHHKEQKVDSREAAGVKARFKLAVENNDIFVVGNDWDYKIIEAQGAQASFLETSKATDIDIARFMGVPSDVIDAERSGSSITYANVVQAHLRMLIINIGPAATRREKALTRLVADPRFVKLKTDALLRMDPETQSRVFGQQIKDRIRVPSEVREKYDLPAYTEEQIDELKTLFPKDYVRGATQGGDIPEPSANQGA